MELDAYKAQDNFIATSRLDYGNSLLFGINKELINKLLRIQNHAARLIYRIRKRDHITSVLTELHWLLVQCTVEFLSQHKIFVYTYSSLHGIAPDYLQNLVTMQEQHC
jgi:hypothetical protein